MPENEPPRVGLIRTSLDFIGLVSRAIRRRKLDFVAVVAFGFLGAAAQIGAIGSLIGFLRLMNSAGAGGTISWRGYHLHSGFGALAIAAGVLALMLAIAAIANYLSVRRARAIGRACTESAVRELIHLIDQAESMPEGLTSSSLRLMGVRGSRLMGVSVENAVRLIHPAAQVVVLVASLFWLDPVVTALLIPVMLVPIPFLWRFNRRVRESAREFYDSAASGFGKAVGQAVDTLQSARLNNKVLRDATLEAYESTPEVDSFFGRYDDMSLTAARAIFISSLFRPLILVYVLLLLGVQVTSTGMTWPDAIAFLLVLLQMTARAEGLVSHFSVLARLYTQVEPFVHFTAHVQKEINEAEGGTEADSEPITLETPAGVAICEPGHPMQVYSEHLCKKFELGLFFKILEPGMLTGYARVRDGAFIGRRYRPSGARCAELVTGQREPTEACLNVIRSVATTLGVRSELDATLGTVIGPEFWQESSPGLRALVQIGPVLCADTPVVIVDLAILTQLERPEAEALIQVLSDREVVILAPDYRSSCNFAESVAVVHDHNLVWAGSAEQWVKAPLRAMLRDEAPKTTAEELDPTLEDELV